MQNLDHYVDFEDHDRNSLPDGIARVTAGSGGEAVAILSSSADLSENLVFR